MSETKLLIVNPNSSASITSALARVLRPHIPPCTSTTFFNPASGPRGISDATTALESTEACMNEMTGPNARLDIAAYHGVLICCFSEHPLISALSDYFAQTQLQIVVLGMFHAAVSSALLTGEPFGIIATGTGPKPNLITAVSTLLGSPTSTRFAGVITSGLAIVDLQDGDQAMVERGMKETTLRLVDQGAETLILGCAGMSGMNKWVIEAARSKGKTVQVVDGARIGVELIVGMIRVSR